MKYKYESVFFDLDGTLFDTSKGIYETFDRVFATRGKTVDKGLYPSFIGPPVSSTLARFFEPGEVAAAHDDFRAYYNSEAKFKARLYDGIEAALAFFKGEKMRIYTATSKSQIMSEELTKKFGIFKYFDKIYGADASVCRVDKADVLRYALADSGENPGSGLLIGDTPYDAEGAELVGMDCLAVTYGFGRREDMTGGRVVGYAANAAEIISVFLRIALK